MFAGAQLSNLNTNYRAAAERVSSLTKAEFRIVIHGDGDLAARLRFPEFFP
jgi:hypothetical protein